MRRFLPHIVASLSLFLIFFCVTTEAIAQTRPLSNAAPLIQSTSSSPIAAASSGWFGEAINRVVVWIVLGILSLFGWLVGITGVLLNFAISYLVIGMGGMILESGFGVAIADLWKLIRDLVNLAFIFALLYLGIETIIQGSTSKVKSALASIIISMLLVNFSLYFAKAVIDVGNFTAYTIYEQAATQPNSPGYVTEESIGLSGVFVHRVGASSLLTSGANSIQQKILDQSVQQGAIGFLIVYAIGASIFLFILAIAFAYGAYILIVRFTTLILVMIFAPVAFLPTTIPALAKLQKRWVDTLVTQSFVAPVYLFGLYLTLLVLMRAPWQTEAGLAALFTGGADFTAGFQALLFYVIAIIMLMATTAAAKSLSASGADISKVLVKAAGKGIAGTASTAGFFGRNVGGRFARQFAESEKWKDRASAGGLKGFAARRVLNTSNAAYKGSWDLRGVKAVGAAAKATGVDVGKASSTSNEKRIKEIKEKELKYAESLNNDLKDDSPEKKAVKEHEKNIEDWTKERRAAALAGEKDLEQKLRTKIEVEKDALSEAKKNEIQAKSANQLRYAKEVLEPGQAFGRGGSWFPWRSKYENKKAADHIRDNVKKNKNKSNTDRLADAYEKAAEKAAKKDGH